MSSVASIILKLGLARWNFRHDRPQPRKGHVLVKNHALRSNNTNTYFWSSIRDLKPIQTLEAHRDTSVHFDERRIFTILQPK